MPTILDTTYPGIPTYPTVAEDYANTIEAMRKVSFDLWVASHASQFNMHNKRKPGQPYSPQVFSDRQGYDRELDNMARAYHRKFDAK
jgi:metallo-beta-lactamase class B